MDERPDIDGLPEATGVYIMKDAGGNVIYVGKAKNLRSRVRSYFQRTGDTRYAARFLASRAKKVDFIVTTNEKEAFLLEDTLLKRHKPRYNIQLKDSKTYISIKITNDDFPRILATRLVKDDGAWYFGPYISAREVRETIKFIRRIFPLCTCSKAVFRNRSRPCLDYQLGLCSAPAIGLISKSEYARLVEGAMLFLKGRNTELRKELKTRMEEAASRMDFEEAARVRDRIRAIDSMLEEQKVVVHDVVDRDVVCLARSDGSLAVVVLFVRSGRLIGSSEHLFEDAGMDDEEITSTFVRRFYSGARQPPPEIILPAMPEDAEVLREWLGHRRGSVVRLFMPWRGEKKRLLEMAEANAREALARGLESASSAIKELEDLAKRLHLPRLPAAIEAFDISNIGPDCAVGAMVRFTNGVPDKKNYRLYRIRTKEGPDDYAMMREALERRFSGAQPNSPLPDLVLIDGGKGQLNIALSVLDELGLAGSFAVAAIAKDRESTSRGSGKKQAFDSAQAENSKPRTERKAERVFLPNVKDPVCLREGSKPDLLIRRIRDEVHRFAVSYHRRLRSGRLASILGKIPGVGPSRTKALFKAFESLDAMAQAQAQAIAFACNVSIAVAEEIKKTASLAVEKETPGWSRPDDGDKD